jgi:hypothetical protein
MVIYIPSDSSAHLQDHACCVVIAGAAAKIWVASVVGFGVALGEGLGLSFRR